MKSKKELLAKKKHIKRKSAKAKHNRVLGIHNPHAAGADIGATEIYIAVPPDRLEMNVRCFGTFTQDLRAIVQWLRENKVTSVAMESTGVYWIPLYELLEQEGFEIYLASITLLSIFLLRGVFFCKMERRGVGRPTLATQH